MMYTIIGADGAEYGPITGDQLRQWILEGRANAQTRARAEGSAEWKPLVEFLEFAPALTGKSGSPPAASATPVTIGPIPVAPRNNPMAVAALVMGILSATVGLCCCYGIPFNVLAIIFGLVALAQIKANPVVEQGRGIAIAGLVLGTLSIALAVLILALGFTMFSSDFLQKLQNQ
jgi:hypothetical protein